MMKNKLMKKAFAIVITLVVIVSAVRIAIGTGHTDTPVAYVISDGTDYYYIDYNQLVNSYLEYRSHPGSAEARLAKFYFDTLGDDIMQSFKAYVSGVSKKFVSYSEVIFKYLDLRDIDSTYIWFNSNDAPPAFPVITKVKILDAGSNVSGRYYVDTDGYIIKRSMYTIDADAPTKVKANAAEEFNVTVSSNDMGAESFEGVLGYEISGEGYTFEYFDGTRWKKLTGGRFEPKGGFTVTPDWTTSVRVRFTAHNAGIYKLTLSLKTTSGEIIAKKELSMEAVFGGMTISASLPTFRVGERAPFTITTKANDDAGKMVQAHFTIPSGASIEYEEEGTGNWITLTDVLGPPSGFELADKTFNLRATFTNAGTKTIKVEFKEVGTGTVLASKNIVANVEKPMEVEVPTLEFYAQEPKVFEIRINSNDDKDKVAQIYVTAPAGALIEFRKGSSTWVPCTGVYVPTDGFEIENDELSFRATFPEAGTFTINVKFVEVGTGLVLASKDITVLVQQKIVPTIAFPGFKDITISSGTTIAKVDFKNPASNQCSFVISLLLEDGTVLYTSDPLAPGEGVSEITLNQALSVGEYDAIVKYEAYSSGGSKLNSAEVKVKLVVKQTALG